MNTMQEEFDAVVVHLFKQRRASVHPIDGCLYRGPGGTTCAVGCRIPDKMYDPRMEGKPVAQLLQLEYEVPSEFRAYLSMFQGLQWAHDNCSREKAERFDMYELKEQLRDVANDCGLNTEVLERQT